MRESGPECKLQGSIPHPFQNAKCGWPCWPAVDSCDGSTAIARNHRVVVLRGRLKVGCLATRLHACIAWRIPAHITCSKTKKQKQKTWRSTVSSHSYSFCRSSRYSEECKHTTAYTPSGKAGPPAQCLVTGLGRTGTYFTASLLNTVCCEVLQKCHCYVPTAPPMTPNCNVQPRSVGTFCFSVFRCCLHSTG